MISHSGILRAGEGGADLADAPLPGSGFAGGGGGGGTEAASRSQSSEGKATFCEQKGAKILVNLGRADFTSPAQNNKSFCAAFDRKSGCFLRSVITL